MVKAVWNDTVIAETEETEIVEGNHYFPPESLSKEYFLESGTQTVCHWKGGARYYTVKVGDRENVDAAWYYPSPKAGASKISGKVAFWKGIKIVTRVIGRSDSVEFQGLPTPSMATTSGSQCCGGATYPEEKEEQDSAA